MKSDEKKSERDRKERIMNKNDKRWAGFQKSLRAHLKEGSMSCAGDFRIVYNILRNRFPDISREAQFNYFREEEMFCDCDLLGKEK